MLQKWLLLALGSAFSFGGMVLVYKKLFLLGIKPIVLNLVLFAFVTFGFLVWNITTKTKIVVTPKMIAWLVVASVFSLLGNYLYVRSVELAPNPGYAATVKAAEIIFITVFSFLLFKSHLNLVSFFGVASVLFGIYLLSK